MKIIYVVPSLIKSGPINVLFNIVKYLDRTKFTPVIVRLRQELEYRNIHKDFEDLNIKIFDFEYKLSYMELFSNRIAKGIDALFPEQDCVFHAHGYFPTLILSKMRNRRTITTIHNICNEDFRMTKGKAIGSYMSWRYLNMLKGLSTCVAISHGMEIFYSKHSKATLQTIYNGVDYKEEKSCSDAIRAKLDISKGTTVLLCASSFSFRKNQKYIIEELQKSARDFVVFFAGVGVEKEKLETMTKGDKRFRFLGYVLNMQKYMCIADCIISASLSEGLPMAILEAVVNGKPCLLSNILPHQEISNNILGNTDFCFEVNKKGSLLSIFERFDTEKYDSNTIREKASKLYTSEVMSKSYQQLYNDIIYGN